MTGIWVSLSAYGGVTTREALAVLWAAGIRQVELAIGVKLSPDTVEVLRQYQQAARDAVSCPSCHCLARAEIV